MNLSSANQVYGRKDGQFHQATQAELSESLVKIGKDLRIRQHPFKGKIIGDATNPDIFTSHNLLIYRLPKTAVTDVLEAGDKYSLASNEKEAASEQDLYYIKNGESILPIDIEIVSHRSKVIKRNRLRPEFVSQYKKKLNPDTFQDSHGSAQLDQNDFELTEANKQLTTKCVQDLVRGLDSMEYLPMDSPGLARVFHQFGVNLRYLG